MELVAGSEHQVKLQGAEDLPLGMDNLISSVGVVTNQYELLQIRRINLLVLAGEEQGGDPHQLELASLALEVLQKPIDDVNREEKSLRNHLELIVHVNYPVDQNGPHFVVYVLLHQHEVVGLAQVVDLGSEFSATNFSG